MRWLENKVPPPLVGLLCGAGIWLVPGAAGPSPVPFVARLVLAATLLVIGFLIAGAGVRAVRKAQTTLNPLKPEEASSLVTSGIYQYTRNPMYVGMALWVLAWSAWLGTLVALIAMPLFVLFITRFQIVPEERALRTIFGPDFDRYCSIVRRWL
jgi:protein-S-isoprenylcysteine O-methyltransferase Ste14